MRGLCEDGAYFPIKAALWQRYVKKENVFSKMLSITGMCDNVMAV